MPRFFVDFKPEGTCFITGENYIHMTRSLRMERGEQVTLCNGDGMDYHCCISGISKESAAVEVTGMCPSPGEPDIRVTLYQCMPKSDKLELIIQKAVELGVFCIVPVLSSRVISRPDTKSLTKKRERWQKISLEAAKQCDRGIIPEIAEAMPFAKLPGVVSSYDRTLFCYEGGGEKIDAVLGRDEKNIAVVIGPEGGFSPQEAEALHGAGAKTVTLGSRILRTETAPLAVLAVLMYRSGNLG